MLTRYSKILEIRPRYSRHKTEECACLCVSVYERQKDRETETETQTEKCVWERAYIFTRRKGEFLDSQKIFNCPLHVP